ncbi:hypothetical protein EKO27_g5491 [Xylaria grammica]|uniref:Uncharacterized protein n=1 Tax=Xylaria grammica TaxID=363999 RepID=A0A439D5G5_9PEZI|nr:hypothetical protein EKO27_g5491 [Xylaria grammica]
MEPPSKRLRLGPSPYPDDDEEDQDELSMTPAQFETTQDPMYQLDKSRAKAATRLKSTFEDIFAKYGKDFEGDDDVINLYTDEIEIDNGHVQSLKSQKDGATENPLSKEEEEEERILNGKPGSRKKKSRSQSLTPANHAGHNQRLQFNSPWNEHPGLGAHRLSSPAFSSFPYLPQPPFDFGHPTFGNSHVDPVWQTPDLPIQPPHYHYGSLIGIGGSQFSSFSGSSNHSVKRLASAKSFLLRDSSTSSGADEVEAEEEDDILLGRNNQEIVPPPHIEDRENAPMLATPISSHRSSQSPGPRLPFHGVGLAEDELCTEPKSPREEVVQTIPTEPLVTEVASTSLQPVNGNSQHSHTARSSHSQSPSRHKGGQPKNSDTLESNDLANGELSNETRPLKQNERRIEIIIPTMKRLLPTEIEQAAAGTAPVADKTLQLPDTGQMVSSENTETTFPKDKLQTSQSTSSHANIVKCPSTDLGQDSQVAQAAKLPKSPKHATSSLEIGGPRRQPSRRRQNHTGPLSANTPPHDEESQENARIGANRESGSSETTTDGSADGNLSGRLGQIEQFFDGDNEIGKIALPQPPSLIAEVAMDEEQAIPDTSGEGDVEVIQVVQHNDKEISVLSAISTGILCDGGKEGTTKMPDSSTTEAIVPDTSESQRLQILYSENDYSPRNQPDHSPIVSTEELLPTRPFTPDNTTTLVATVCSSEVADARGVRISTPKQDVESRSPEPLAIRETTESDIYPDGGRLSPTFEASDTCEEQEYNTRSGSVCDSVLVTEINGLQLWSDGQKIQRSPSLGAMELPDQDLSVFPTMPDPAHSTSELVLRPLSRPTENDGQCTSGIGRSPSPELGTPIGPDVVREAASQTRGPRAPATPTRKQGPKSAKPRSSHRRTPSSKRFPLTSLTPGDIDDDSDDELSMAFAFSGRSSRFHSPFSRASTNNNPELPPLLSTPRQKTRKHSLLMDAPSSSTRISNQTSGAGHSKNTPPATESRQSDEKTPRNPNKESKPSGLTPRHITTVWRGRFCVWARFLFHMLHIGPEGEPVGK